MIRLIAFITLATLHLHLRNFTLFPSNKAKQANKVRRVDRRTNALPHRQTDQPTDRSTDTASYRGALSHLKTKFQFMKVGLKGNSFPSAPVKKSTLWNCCNSLDGTKPWNEKIVMKLSWAKMRWQRREQKKCIKKCHECHKNDVDNGANKIKWYRCRKSKQWHLVDYDFNITNKQPSWITPTTQEWRLFWRGMTRRQNLHKLMGRSKLSNISSRGFNKTDEEIW